MDAPVGSASVVIRRAAADVFTFVTTPENDPLWVRVCKGIRRLGAEPIRLGARLIEQVRFLGFVVPYTWEVTRFEPGRAITYSSRKGIVPMVITIAIESDGDSTRVTQQIELLVRRAGHASASGHIGRRGKISGGPSPTIHRRARAGASSPGAGLRRLARCRPLF